MGLYHQPGITLAVADARYVEVGGDTMTGDLLTTGLRARSGETMAIKRQDGTTWALLDSGAGVTKLQIVTAVDDGFEFRFGSSGDVAIAYSAVQTNDGLLISTPVGSAAGSGNIVITTQANKAFDHAHVVATEPTLILHSAAASTTQWISMRHTGTAGRIDLGAGNLTLSIAGGNVRALITNTTSLGLTTVAWIKVVTRNLRADDDQNLTITQSVNASGSPTLLTLTGSAHTTLATTAEAIAVNIDLSARVEWATGAIVLQRGMLIQAQELAFVGASVVTTAATLAIDNQPQAGDNATITQPCAFLVMAGNVGLFSSTPTFGSGAEVLFVGDATTAPTVNPTSGGILYSAAGAGTWRGSGGTTTTFAFADPICPHCGRDFGWQWVNDGTTAGHRGGRLAICGWCLLTMLEAEGIDTDCCLIGDRLDR